MAWTVGSVAKPTSPVVSIYFFFLGGGGGHNPSSYLKFVGVPLIKIRIRPCTYCTSCDITHYVDNGRYLLSVHIVRHYVTHYEDYGRYLQSIYILYIM